jgi:hypothetical protein
MDGWQCGFGDFEKTFLYTQRYLNSWAGTDVMIFKKIFAEKFGEKIGVFDSKQR